MTLVLLSGPPAAAVVFAPVQPETCPNWTYVNWQYNVFSSEEMVSRDDFGNAGNYSNNVDYTVEVTANERVNEFHVRFDYFATEPVYDYLQLYNYSPDGNGANNYYSDVVPWQQGQPVWGWMSTVWWWPFPLANASIRFHTDSDDNYSGVWLGYGAVCTRNPGALLNNYSRTGVPGRRHTGVMLGANDVVYLMFPNGAIKEGENDCSIAHDTFALQADSGPGNDFDLYVRCGALPTPTEYDALDYSGPSTSPVTGVAANTGFVHAPNNCPCGSYWYVAVHSYSGDGWFNLWNHKHYWNQHRSNLSTSLDVNASAGDVQNLYVPAMQGGLAHFYGANEGARYWDTMTFVDDADPVLDNAQVEIHANTNRPHAYCSEDWYCGWFVDCDIDLPMTWMGYGSYEPETMSHELGHYINCLADEYDDEDGNYCGHSIMDSQFGSQNNYCYCGVHASTCPNGYGDHGRDANGGTIPLGLTAAWPELANRSPVVFHETPDNYDFLDFDFHGVYAAPTVTDRP